MIGRNTLRLNVLRREKSETKWIRLNKLMGIMPIAVDRVDQTSIHMIGPTMHKMERCGV